MKKTLYILLLTILLASQLRADNDLLERFNLGLEKESQEDYISAIYIYQDILKANRYFLDVKIALARSLYKTGDLKESEKVIRDALEQDGKNVHILNLMGRILIALKNYKEAEQIFMRALEIEPINIETRYGIADLYRSQEKYKKAIEIYNELLKLYPQDVWTYIHLGSSYSELGEYTKAGGFFRKALSLDSTSPWTHINLARHYYRMGILNSPSDSNASERYFDAAVYEAETSSTIDKKLLEPYYILSSIYFFRKNYNRALEAYNRLLDRGVDDSITYYETAYCYEMLGMLEESEEAYAKSLAKRIDDEVSRFRLENIVLALRRENLTDKRRMELSDNHLFKARFLTERFIMDKAFLHYKRSVQLDPINPQKRLELADFLRTRGRYELYLYELRDIIHDTLDIDTIDINDRIEIYQSRVSKNLSSQWKVNQYIEDEKEAGFIPKSKTKVAIFDSFVPEHLPREKFIHRRLSQTMMEMLSWVLFYYSKIEVVQYEGEITTDHDALKAARALGVDYYVTGTLEETEDAVKIGVNFLSGFNGRVNHSFTTYYTGKDKLFNAVVSIAEELNNSVPTAGLIVRLEGNKALINLGSSHGVEKDMTFLIFRQKGLERNPETGEYTLDPDISLGKLTITETDEMVAEGTYEFTGMHNRVNVYDNVILINEEDEPTEEN
ncbi:MAG: tetratricopeptide repeat protein [Spirochaetota bacterium]|nr:MAG: tetratricopeptide repeat protein [Spirochaetota bacterium]